MSNRTDNFEETVTSRKPRRVYPYKGTNLICFVGQRWQSDEESKIDSNHPVIRAEVESRDAKEVVVTQRKRGRKGVTEVWTLFLG